jgi:hypothetical protein
MMSSGTSTDAAPATFRPWHFFVLVGLAGATIAVVTVRPSGIAPLVLVVLAAFAGAYVGYAVYRMIVPLAARDFTERVEMVGGRTRAALDREKTLVLRSLKELEFDRAMGKVSATDFHEMGGRLRFRARSLLKQLDVDGATYRDQIERELAERLMGFGDAGAEMSGPSTTRLPCGDCGASNERDAKFCKACGAAL